MLRIKCASNCKANKSVKIKSQSKKENDTSCCARGCNIIIIIECHCSLPLASKPWLRTPFKRNIVVNSIRFCIACSLFFSEIRLDFLTWSLNDTNALNVRQVLTILREVTKWDKKYVTFTNDDVHLRSRSRTPQHTHSRLQIASYILCMPFNRESYDFLLPCVQHTSNPCHINQIKPWFGTNWTEKKKTNYTRNSNHVIYFGFVFIVMIVLRFLFVSLNFDFISR